MLPAIPYPAIAPPTMRVLSILTKHTYWKSQRARPLLSTSKDAMVELWSPMSGSFRVLCRKVDAFGEGRPRNFLSLRSERAPCAQIRSMPWAVAIVKHGDSRLPVQPLVLRGPSPHRVCSCYRSSWPNLALERPRRKRALFGVLSLVLPCLVMARHRRAVQRRR
jgi:hypothetical protein